MREQLTHAIEDYLKTIYDLSASFGRAGTNQIAEALRVTPASVTGMIKKLASTDPPLVIYEKHRGVVLSEEGERIALELVRHHRLLELFLHQILGYDWDQVHDEADRLEHVISEDFEEKIAAALGNPRHDPHGDPIPTRDLVVPITATTSMVDLRPGQSAVIKRVRDTDAELLRYLSEQGVTPHARLSVVGYTPFDNNLHILVEGQEQPIVLGEAITSKVFVEVLTPEAQRG